MRYFEFFFEWHTRPRFRKGRLRTAFKTFAAEDQTQAYELARAEGKKMFPRHRWAVVGFRELTGSHEQSTSVGQGPIPSGHVAETERVENSELRGRDEAD